MTHARLGIVADIHRGHGERQGGLVDLRPCPLEQPDDRERHPHVMIQSLIGPLITLPEPGGSYLGLKIADPVFELTVRGRDPFHLRLPFRPSGERRWLGK